MKHDFIVLTETWAESGNHFENSFPGFTVFSTWRQKKLSTGRFSGGVCTLVRNSFIDSVKQVQTNLQDCIFLLLKGVIFNLEKDILFCGIYIPPEHSTFYNNLDSNNGVELFETE